MSAATNWEDVYRTQTARIAELERENAALRKELEAQAVVNGKGSEREAKLLAEVAALRKQLEQWNQSTEWFAEWAEKKQELERENAALREVLREIADASGFDNIGNWARKKAKNALAKEAQP